MQRLPPSRFLCVGRRGAVMEAEECVLIGPSDASPAIEPATKTHAERWLTAVVESSDDAIIGESLNGVITSWNPAAERIFGYAPDDVIGQPMASLVCPGDEDQVEMLLQRMREGHHIEHFQTVRRHKNGSKVYVSLTLSPIVDAYGEVIGIAETARDITDRVALQESLTASTQQVRLLTEREAWAKALIMAERRFRDLIENSPDVVLQVNTQGTILIANRTAETAFGYSPAELVGANIDMLIPDMRHSALAWNQAFAHPGITRSLGQGLDLYASRKDGTEFPVEISLNPVEIDGHVHITAALRDITERKRTEEQVRTLQESYMAELEARQKEAERLNRTKSDFMAGITHELRTPLHTILGFSELLREESEGPLNETQKSFLDHIRRDSEHLLRLINDVLDYSRIDAGGMHLHTESLSVGEAVRSAVGAIGSHADTKGIAIECEGDAGELRVLADAMRLRQILYNLLSNAVKFTPPAGKIRVSARQEGGFVRFTVSDNGIGISLEEQPRIFERFYQVGHTTGGAGLGLAICRQLVQMQGGTIFVESEPGSGSRFHFTLHKAM